MASRKQELTEKLGLKYFRKLDEKVLDKKYHKRVYSLDEDEKRNILKIGRQAVANAFIIGVVTSAVTALVLLNYGKHLMSIKDYLDKSNLDVVIIIIVASVVTSLIEMVFLFFCWATKITPNYKSCSFRAFFKKRRRNFCCKINC